MYSIYKDHVVLISDIYAQFGIPYGVNKLSPIFKANTSDADLLLRYEGLEKNVNILSKRYKRRKIKNSIHNSKSAERELENVKNFALPRLEQKISHSFDTFTRAAFHKKKLHAKEISLSFTFTSFDPASLSELYLFSQCISRTHVFDSLVKEREDFVWATCSENLSTNRDKKMVRAFSSGFGDTAGGAVGSIGWSTGIHSWTLCLQGDHLLSGFGIYSIIVGVIPDACIPEVKTSVHRPSSFMGYCSFKDDEKLHYDKIAGDWKPISDCERVTVRLDCDEGILSIFFLHYEAPSFQLRVPKNEPLYPFVYFRDLGNSVTIV